MTGTRDMRPATRSSRSADAARRKPRFIISFYFALYRYNCTSTQGVEEIVYQLASRLMYLFLENR